MKKEPNALEIKSSADEKYNSGNYLGALNEYNKAIKLLDNGLRRMSKNDAIELKLIKTHVFILQGKSDQAKSLLDEITSEEKLPRHLKQKSEEIIGMMHKK